ncbi:hypothetical protein KTH81_15125 [Lachnospiraceae bacterium ASD3451]|uniref:hypothetical protein n=1 Tax=Diplocloster agilis TaxID=2850323 RepID=UPI001E030E73|nr:hypothetical protein [Diplocloster agilis]MBU9745154.1 hypothetical protein [Diplocloster agilis]
MKIRELMPVFENCDPDADVVYIDAGYDPTDKGFWDKIGEAYSINSSTCHEGPIVVLRGE